MQNEWETERKRSSMIHEMKTGADATVSVGKWTRLLASQEARMGKLGAALQVAPAPAVAFAREAFGSFYGFGVDEVEIPEEERAVGSEWVRKLHEAASSLPEVRALAERCRGDGWCSGIATTETLNAVTQIVPFPKADPAKLREERDLIKSITTEAGKTSPKLLRRLADANRKLKAAEDEAHRAAEFLAAPGGASQVRVALREAAEKARAVIVEMDSAMSGFGCGNGPGMESRVNAPTSELRSALMRNDKLRRVMALAGRMKSKAIAKRATKARPGAEELCDLTLSGDIQRLVPSELLGLAEPALELSLMRKLMERSAMTYELRGRTPQAQGPIIFVVDESGSMSGHRDEMAKAAALAAMEIAARENRAFSYVRFASYACGVDRWENPRMMNLAELEAFVTKFANGGTAIGAGLQAARLELDRAALKRADVILISDGESSDYDKQDEAKKAIAAHEASLYGIFIDTRAGTHAESLCDHAIHINNAQARTGEKVEVIFG